jgi:iron-sulfur cluster assembly protein
MINLTELAAKKVTDMMNSRGLANYGLRVFVQGGGGCSGLQYGMAFFENPEEDDIISEIHGVKVFVDPISAQFLESVEIDYFEDAMNSGFRITNPNMISGEGGCACGGGGCGCGGHGGGHRHEHSHQGHSH